MPAAISGGLGVRPYPEGGGIRDRRDALYFTSNYNTLTDAEGVNIRGTLEGTMRTGLSYLGARFPLDRHDNKARGNFTGDGTFTFDPAKKTAGRINVAFCDGHAASVDRGDFANVRITPYKKR